MTTDDAVRQAIADHHHQRAMLSRPALAIIADLEAQVAALTARAERAEATMIDENSALRDLASSLIAARNETAVKADRMRRERDIARRWSGRWKEMAYERRLHHDDLMRTHRALMEKRAAVERERDLLAYTCRGGSVGAVIAALGLPDGPDTQDWARLLETWRQRGEAIVKGGVGCVRPGNVDPAERQ